MEQNNSQYFAVVYCTEDYKSSIHLLPGVDQQDCLNKLKQLKDDPKTCKRIKATTVIKRDMSNFKDGLIFGCPKSLNVMEDTKTSRKKKLA